MHPVQDTLLTIGSLVLVAALLPTIFGKSKPSVLTSLPTAFTLLMFSGIYFSLGLRVSAFTTSASSLCWFVLAYQKLKQRK